MRNGDFPPEPDHGFTDVGEQNVERLLGASYRPEDPDPQFAREVTARLCAAGRAAAVRPAAAPRADDERLRRLRRRLGWSMGLAAAVAVVALALYATQRRGDLPQEVSGLGAGSDDGLSVQPANHRGGPAGFGLTPRPRPEAPAVKPLKVGDSLSTRAGERRRVTLADGSVLYLNQNTRVTQTSARRLSLDGGDIYLEVAPRAQGATGASFVVQTPQRKVSALGTHFAVHAGAAGTGVVVTQGKVRVAGLSELVRAGQQLPPGASEVSPAPRASHQLDWTRELMAAAESPLVPCSKHAGGALIAVDPNGQEMRLTLRKYHIDVHIEDGFARTTIDQTYFNHESGQLEGTFYFPLPPDASLSRLAMYVEAGGMCQLMEGGMAEANLARNAYETIRYARRDPALLEWVDGSTFKMRVFPLEGRKEKRLLLSYTQRLESLYGVARYRFPGGHNMDYVADWSFAARVKGGAALHCSSPTHPGIKLDPRGGDMTLSLRARHVKPDRDVTLEITGRTPDQEAARFAAFTHENARYLMVRYVPRLEGAPRRERRDWVFLFESSANRDPLLARAQIEVVRGLLKNAEHDDTFQILTAGTRVRLFDRRPRPNTPANVEAAVKFLEGTHLVGALDLAAALKEARALLKAGKNPYLVHVGAGVPAMGERREDALVRLLPDGVRYVGVGVGKRWNRAFLKAAAERSGGYFTQINPDEPLAWRAFELLATLNTPRLMELSVVDDAERVAFLRDAASLAQGEELCAIARVEGKGGALPEKMTISGKLDGKLFVRHLAVKDVAEGAGYLPRTWAKLEIDRLLADGGEKHKAKIIELSKAMYVMSPYTSLLVLETEADYARFKVDRGRKDHWAMYACPAKIPVVYEPLWQNVPAGPAEDGKRPTAEQVLNSVLVRVPTQPIHFNGRIQTHILTGLQVYNGAYALATLTESHYLAEITRRGDLGMEFETLGDRVSYDRLADFDPLGRLGGNESREMMARKGTESMPGLRLLRPRFRTQLSDLTSRDFGWYRPHEEEGFRRLRLTLDDMAETTVNFRLTELLADAPALDLRNFYHVQVLSQRGAEHKMPIREAELGQRLRRLYGEKQRARGLRIYKDSEIDKRLRDEWHFDGELLESAPRLTLPVVRQLLEDLEEKGGVPWREVKDSPRQVGRILELYARSAYLRHARTSLLYQRPTVTRDNRLFGDLVSYAPGMNTTFTDLQAVLEAEAAPAPGKQAGVIDPAARALIDKARAGGWQAAALPGVRQRPGARLVFNAAGQFALDHKLDTGLRELIVCDGKTLLHLYPEIGLGARRTVSRFHRAQLLALLPWLLPPAEDLTHGADLKRLDERTVTVTPRGAAVRRNAEGKPVPYHELRLTFAEDGGLCERRLVRMPEGKVVSRETYTDGTVKLYHGEDAKPAAEDAIRLTDAAAPDLTPDVAKLVVVPMPLRTRAQIFARPSIVKAKGNFANWDADDAIALIASDCARADGGASLHLFSARFHAKGDRRLGFYTLLAAARYGLDPLQDYALNGVKVRFDMVAEHPGNPLALYLGFHNQAISRADRVPLGPIGGPADGFVQRLAAFRDLCRHWEQGKGRHEIVAKTRAEVEKTVAYAREAPPPFAWLLLNTVQMHLGSADHATVIRLAEALRTAGAEVGMGYTARYEYACALFRADRRDQARAEFRKLYADGLKAGVLPRVEGVFRDAFQSGPQGAQEWAGFMRQTARQLARERGAVAVLPLAAQVHQLGTPLVAEELFAIALELASGDERRLIALAGVRYLADAGENARAATQLESLLKDEKLSQVPAVWRLASDLATRRNLPGRAVAYLEKALDLEYGEMPEVVNLEQVRADYQALLTQYQGLASAFTMLETEPNRDFLAKVVRAADRWRVLDPDGTAACQAAGRILRTLGARDLAWDYLTTPIGLKPGEAGPWVSLAQAMQKEGEFDLADRAYATAFATEQTNAQILWDRAQNLQRVGRLEEARRLYQQLLDGTWQERFRPLQQQAGAYLQGR